MVNFFDRHRINKQGEIDIISNTSYSLAEKYIYDVSSVFRDNLFTFNHIESNLSSALSTDSRSLIVLEEKNRLMSSANNINSRN